VELILALILILTMVGAAIAGGWWADRHSRRATDEQPAGWLHEAARHRLLVHTRDGQTLDGQLARVDADGLVLDPVTLADGDHRLAGSVWVPRERVAFVQHPGQEGA
jgi:hypothetical protein